MRERSETRRRGKSEWSEGALEGREESGEEGGGRGGEGVALLMPEHSAARVNRVNCSGGQGVQHSSGTPCLHGVAVEGGQGRGARGTTHREGNHVPQTLC